MHILNFKKNQNQVMFIVICNLSLIEIQFTDELLDFLNDNNQGSFDQP